MTAADWTFEHDADSLVSATGNWDATDSNRFQHIFLQIGLWKTKSEHRPRQQTNVKGHIEFKDHREQDYLTRSQARVPASNFLHANTSASQLPWRFLLKKITYFQIICGFWGFAVQNPFIDLFSRISSSVCGWRNFTWLSIRMKGGDYDRVF